MCSACSPTAGDDGGREDASSLTGSDSNPGTVSLTAATGTSSASTTASTTGAPTSSTTAMLVMGDALAMAVMRARDFKPRDFALRHPAGAIGRALLLKIEDIMRRGDRSAIAPETLSVKEALLVMTRAKSGSVSVVNKNGKLVGVFTDGDLRRRMAEDSDVLSRPLKQVMTRKPICVRVDAAAVEALRIFNSRNIDDLIVVNQRREPVGLVDTQDLPKFKLM